MNGLLNSQNITMVKLKWLSLLVCLFICSQIAAQKNKVVVSGNNDIAASIPDSIKYLYPGFIFGKVYFRDGTVGGSMLNDNLLTGEMQFINPSGDTLSLANEVTIQYITINEDTFYYDNAYLKLIAENRKAKLAQNEKLSLSDIKKGTAYNSYTSLGGIDNVTSLNLGSRMVNLTDDKQMIFVMHRTLFIGDAYNHFVPATMRNVRNLFGKNKGLDTYLSKHKIDFTKEDDLKTLIDFLGNQE